MGGGGGGRGGGGTVSVFHHKGMCFKIFKCKCVLRPTN